MSTDFCGTTDSALQRILLALIRSIIESGKEVTVTEVKAAVEKYHSEGRPTGYKFFYKLPTERTELYSLMNSTIMLGLREGSLTLALKKERVIAHKLSKDQKRQIDQMLRRNKSTPAEQTIGDDVKKLLNLSDKEYDELQDEIEDYIGAFFRDITSRNLKH